MIVSFIYLLRQMLSARALKLLRINPCLSLFSALLLSPGKLTLSLVNFFFRFIINLIFMLLGTINALFMRYFNYASCTIHKFLCAMCHR